jgi:outer membrane protein insertion porin family
VSLEIAGDALGGSNQFLKGSLDSSVYFPMPKGASISFRHLIGAGAGFGGERLPAGERYFVGGMRTVRGFDYGEAGPLDFDPLTGLGSGDPEGATKEWVMSAEFAFPLVKAANLKAALFVDWGAGFGNGEAMSPSELNLSWGYEIRWISPLGPLRFGFGWVLDDQRPAFLQRNGQQLFTIGTFF